MTAVLSLHRAKSRLKKCFYENWLYTTSKQLLFAGMFHSGLVHIFRRRQPDSVLVLIYHDVLPPGFPKHNPLFGMTVSTTEFEWQLRYLRRYYNPITFQEFAKWFSNGYDLPAYPVLVTFDDGHSNNFDFALPILSKLSMTAVCFIVSGSLGKHSLTWFEDAYYRLMFSASPNWKLKDGEILPLSTDDQRAAACGRFFVLCRSLKESAQIEEVYHRRGDYIESRLYHVGQRQATKSRALRQTAKMLRNVLPNH